MAAPLRCMTVNRFGGEKERVTTRTLQMMHV